MALSIVLQATGLTQSDLESALEEALRSIKRGNTSGSDRDGEDGNYHFEIDGEEEFKEETD